MFAEFFNDFALGDEELASFEVGASAGGIFPGFLREAGEGIVNPEELRLRTASRGQSLTVLGVWDWFLVVFHRVFRRVIHMVFHRLAGRVEG